MPAPRVCYYARLSHCVFVLPLHKLFIPKLVSRSEVAPGAAAITPGFHTTRPREGNSPGSMSQHRWRFLRLLRHGPRFPLTDARVEAHAAELGVWIHTRRISTLVLASHGAARPSLPLKG